MITIKSNGIVTHVIHIQGLLGDNVKQNSVVVEDLINENIYIFGVRAVSSYGLQSAPSEMKYAAVLKDQRQENYFRIPNYFSAGHWGYNGIKAPKRRAMVGRKWLNIFKIWG